MCRSAFAVVRLAWSGQGRRLAPAAQGAGTGAHQASAVVALCTVEASPQHLPAQYIVHSNVRGQQMARKELKRDCKATSAAADSQTLPRGPRPLGPTCSASSSFFCTARVCC